VIAKLNEISSSIAAAVVQQSTVSRDISDNMQTAAVSVVTISKNMNEIAQAASTASDASRKVQEASRALAQ
jgi:methyl-accepting chemotaxis protein